MVSRSRISEVHKFGDFPEVESMVRKVRWLKHPMIMKTLGKEHFYNKRLGHRVYVAQTEDEARLFESGSIATVEASCISDDAARS